jgi:GNAT superfamily N-acetyltransferase
MTMLIRRAEPGDGDRLREVAFAAKAHWGYDHDLVRDWADALSLPGDEERWVAEDGEKIVGWASLERSEDGVAVLDDLWVAPAAMGRGIGSALFAQVASAARARGARSLEWGADPNAVPFYEHVGGRYLRDHVSEWGRTLPWMGLEL